MNFVQFEIGFTEILGIIQTLSIIVAIVQLRKYIKNSKSQAFSRIGGRLQSINNIMIEKADVYMEISKTPEEVLESVDKVTEMKMQILMDMVLSYFREIYYQHNRYDQIDKEQWQGWQESIHRILSKPYAKWYWEKKSNGYPKKFVDFVNSLLKTDYQNLEIFKPNNSIQIMKQQTQLDESLEESKLKEIL